MASKSRKKPPTAAEMDQEFQEMLEKMKEKNKNYKYEDGFTEENIDEILRTHPAFMNKQPTQEDIDNSPLLQGLQNLQYEDDDDTPEAKALAYKEDGNWHFKKRLYEKAIRAYTEGLNKKCSDKSLNSTLYANRAAANFYLENYRSSLKDSTEALKLEPNRVKSLLRCAQCCEALEKYPDAIEWVKKLLALEPENSTAKDLLSRTQKSLKVAERDRRKKEKQEKAKGKNMQALVDAIRGRGIKLDLRDVKRKQDDQEFLCIEDALVLSSVDNNNPSHAKVHFEDDSIENLAENGKLVWPVLFTYPEYQISEVVEEFHEDSSFSDHVDVMFDDPAPWDTAGYYSPSTVEVYHETGGGERVHGVPLGHTLRQTLSSGKMTIRAGTPVFIIVSSTSPFKDKFLGKYKT